MRIREVAGIFRKKPVYVKAVALAAVSVICFAGIYFRDNSRKISTNESGQTVLERGENGKDRIQEMEVRIGDMEEKVEVEISGRAYTQEELGAVLDEAEEELAGLVLGENDSADEVRSPLNLITEVPGTGIAVSWEMDRYDVIDLQGNIQGENLTEEGVMVRLTAALTYEDIQRYCEFYVHVFPPEISGKEKLLNALRAETQASDEATKTEEYIVLPEQIGREKVEWSFGTDQRAYAVLILGIGMSCMLVVSDGQKKKEEEKRMTRQMKIDYPQIINKFNLYIRAGMTVRRAWFLIVHDYEKRNSGKVRRKAYEEMAAAMHQIRGGLPEGECYENYGIRCKELSYRKFGMMLSQNLRKGSRGLTDLLAREAEEAFEDRKKLAKKLGEEAGTKLMIPMFLMLIIVFAIVIVPALFSIQIT